MTREALWSPTWNSVIIGWTKQFIRRNLWRVDPLHDFDDLMQDAYLVFLRVKAAYPRVTEPQHFMSLYKVAMLNELTNKTRVKQRTPEMVGFDDVSDHIITFNHTGELQVAMNCLPVEVKEALSKIDNPDKLRSRNGQVRENLNAILRRVAKLPKGIDAIGPIREALT